MVHDLSGLELAGDGQTAGTNYVRTFSVEDQQTTTNVASNFSSGSMYGQTITLSATVAAVSGTPSGTVQFFADGSDLGSPAVLVNGTASISLSTLPAGNDAITAAYTSDSSGYADSATDPGNPLTQVVSPAPLTITANNQVMVYGGTIPALTATYTGFVNGDTSASLTTPPNLTTTATPTSSVGSYDIDASGAIDPNYNISYAKGTLTVTTAPVVSTMLVENGLTERSYVDQLTFEFNNPMVSTAAVPMTLTDFGTQGNLDQAVTLTPGQFQWTAVPGTGASVLTWSLESFAGGTSSLSDGYYQVTLPNALITDPYGLPLNGGTDYTADFFVLQGDVNGDGVVDNADMTAVDACLGSRPGSANWNPNADLTRAGTVTTIDRIIVYENMGHSITPRAGSGHRRRRPR